MVLYYFPFKTLNSNVFSTLRPLEAGSLSKLLHIQTSFYSHIFCNLTISIFWLSLPGTLPLLMAPLNTFRRHHRLTKGNFASIAISSYILLFSIY